MLFKSVRELIYTRPRMFIGKYWSGDKWDNQALQVLIMLVIRQSVDSDTLNGCNVLKVILLSEDEIIIEDDGIGLPIEPLSYLGDEDTAPLTNLLEWYMPTGILTKEHYTEYGFLGYFARLLNVLSESLRIDTVRQGQAYSVLCSRGEIVTPLQKSDNSILNQGTRISFKPDPDVFQSPVFIENSLKTELNKLASEFPQVMFEFTAINVD